MRGDAPSPVLIVRGERRRCGERYQVADPRRERSTELRDIATGRQTITVPRDYPAEVRFADADLVYDDSGIDIFEVHQVDPLSASARSDRAMSLSRSDAACATIPRDQF